MGGRYRAGRVEIITEPLNASIRRIHSDGQPCCKSILNIHDIDYFTFSVQTLLYLYYISGSDSFIEGHTRNFNNYINVF